MHIAILHCFTSANQLYYTYIYLYYVTDIFFYTCNNTDKNTDKVYCFAGVKQCYQDKKQLINFTCTWSLSHITLNNTDKFKQVIINCFAGGKQ
jgi:hypothetical protein